jgi:hypothetical protein
VHTGEGGVFEKFGGIGWLMIVSHDPGALASPSPIQPTVVHNKAILIEAARLLCDQLLVYWMFAQIRKQPASNSST